MKDWEQRSGSSEQGEQGYLLFALVVAIAIILIGLSVAAADVARSLRREREVESVRRGNQFVRAIQLYYRKFGHYPGSIEQLEKTNNIRFLRQRYVDPLTGKPDWRVIGVGKNQTTVKGFFGEPLTGLATANLGAAAGSQSAGFGAQGGAGIGGAGIGGAGIGGIGAPGAGGAAGVGAAAGPGAAANGAGTVAGTADPSASTGGFGTPGGIGGQSATSFGGSGSGPFMGVGSSATGTSLVEPNAQTTYEKWEFLYDPRIELLKAKAALSSGIGSVGAGALGQTPGAFGTPPSGFGATPTPTSGQNGQAPNGGTPPKQP